jgi:hypothetical protein
MAPFWNLAKKSSSRLMRLPNGVEQLNVLIEIRLELSCTDDDTFLGLRFDRELDSSDVVDFLWPEAAVSRPSWVPITDPERTRLPETEVPVGEEPERLFPDEPGLKRGGGGGGSDRLDRTDAKGSGSGHVPVPLDELDDDFRAFFRVRADFRLLAEWLLRTRTPRASFSSLDSLGGGGGDLR